MLHWGKLQGGNEHCQSRKHSIYSKIQSQRACSYSSTKPCNMTLSQTSQNLVSFKGTKDKLNHSEFSLTTIPRFSEDRALVKTLKEIDVLPFVQACTPINLKVTLFHTSNSQLSTQLQYMKIGIKLLCTGRKHLNMGKSWLKSNLQSPYIHLTSYNLHLHVVNLPMPNRHPHWHLTQKAFLRQERLT